MKHCTTQANIAVTIAGKLPEKLLGQIPAGTL